jgi:hypothetical protein
VYAFVSCDSSLLTGQNAKFYENIFLLFYVYSTE